jgi:hypothetical protein
MKFLFSITVHESINALNDLIESILFFNKQSYIVIHVNSSWSDFSDDNILYIKNRVFVNPNRFLLLDRLSGKTGIHISNIEYFNTLNIDYEYVVLTASNELYLKKIDESFFNKNKYGSDFLSISENSKYYKTIPHPDTSFINKATQNIKNELLDISQNSGIFGGRHEGMFFIKKISDHMIEVYRNYFGKNVDLCRCDEEIIPHTILYNFVDPTDTESLCYWRNHHQQFNLQTIYNFTKDGFDPHKDSFTKLNNNFKKFSIKGIPRNDFKFRNEIRKFFI